MRRLLAISIILFATLFFTGCASTPSIEEQTKLIEYEKCLAFAMDQTNLMLETLRTAPNASLEERLNYAFIDDFDKALDSQLKKCKKYRP